MKLITGWIVPEMNWARKLAWKSASFCSAKSSRASCWWPKTLTRLCPVCISST